MALPTSPIPLVATGEIIEENWGDSVAQSLNNLKQRKDASNWKPTAEIQAPTAATMTTWFNYGGGTGTDLTIPDWATLATVRLEMNGVRNLGTPNATYDVQLFFGTVPGRIIRVTATSDAGWFPLGWTDQFASLPGAGARKLLVKVAKVSGGNRWTIDTDSDIAFDVDYGGAIGWYPGL